MSLGSTSVDKAAFPPEDKNAQQPEGEEENHAHGKGLRMVGVAPFADLSVYTHRCVHIHVLYMYKDIDICTYVYTIGVVITYVCLYLFAYSFLPAVSSFNCSAFGFKGFGVASDSNKVSGCSNPNERAVQRLNAT